MMVNPINRLSANDAAFKMMNDADCLCSCKGNSNDLALDMINNSLIYKANSAMELSKKKATEENIKRTFSVFA